MISVLLIDATSLTTLSGKPYLCPSTTLKQVVFAEHINYQWSAPVLFYLEISLF